MNTGVLQNQNKLARVAQDYGKRGGGVVTNFIQKKQLIKYTFVPEEIYIICRFT